MTVVLTPIDGSELSLGAVPWAATLAGPTGTVLLLRVIPPHHAQRNAQEPSDDERAQGIQNAWASAAEAELDEAAHSLEPTDVNVKRLVVAGEPDEEIVAAATRHGADLIAMASRGRGAIGRAIFGSVADRVARTATMPVLIVRAATEETGTPVAIGVPVHVVRAVDPVTSLPMGRGVFGTAPMVSAEITDQIWQEAESEAKATVADAIAHLKGEGIAASGAVLNGSPFFAINDATRPGDLIVLTSHGHGGVRRWLLGSVAEKLVREASVPVLLVPAVERGRVTG
ncbi:MAG: UspA domain protein [Thermomicrobiales bacterium]|nr:UspA domain protein [Thermomicrobiales bacterium]